MKKIISLTALLLAPQLAHAMELEKIDFKPKNVSKEDYEKFLPAALFCAIVYHENHKHIKRWLDKNYYFDEFYSVQKHVKNLEPHEETTFINMFKSLDDKTIQNKLSIHRGLQKHSIEFQKNKSEQEENPSPNSKPDYNALDQLFSLLGYAEDQPEEYYQLPRELRSLYTRFFTWPKLLQDDAILRGIENHQIPKLKRKEFLAIQPEDQKRLANLFALNGYNIEKPENSSGLKFKSLQEINKKKLAVKVIKEIIHNQQQKKIKD